MNAQHLKALRERFGLSRKKLADVLGVSCTTIAYIERNSCLSPYYQNYLSRIQDYLENYGKKNELIKQTPAFSFALQHLYSISDRRPGHSDCLNILNIEPDTGMNCVFKYVGKHGKHHCFVSIRGGWSRTYTDTQLIGKIIQEVTL